MGVASFSFENAFQMFCDSEPPSELFCSWSTKDHEPIITPYERQMFFQMVFLQSLLDRGWTADAESTNLALFDVQFSCRSASVVLKFWMPKASWKQLANDPLAADSGQLLERGNAITMVALGFWNCAWGPLNYKAVGSMSRSGSFRCSTPMCQSAEDRVWCMDPYPQKSGKNKRHSSTIPTEAGICNVELNSFAQWSSFSMIFSWSSIILYGLRREDVGFQVF